MAWSLRFQHNLNASVLLFMECFVTERGLVQCNPVCDYETRIDFASRNAVYQETLQPHSAKGSIPGRLPSRLARHLVPVLFRTRCADSGFHILLLLRGRQGSRISKDSIHNSRAYPVVC
jgi:hypothetical protein